MATAGTGHSISEIAVQLQPFVSRAKASLSHSISEIAVQLQQWLPVVDVFQGHSISEIAVQLQPLVAADVDRPVIAFQKSRSSCNLVGQILSGGTSHSISEIAVQLQLAPSSVS